MESAGWAVVVAADEPNETLQALAPLIDHRKAGIGRERCKILTYRQGEKRHEWLARHKVVAGAVDPVKVPYYLMLVGPPDRVPYAFQVLLDVEYAVGRVDLATPDAYRKYAEGVVAHESKGGAAEKPGVALFGTNHPGDPATNMSATQLVDPLATALEKSTKGGVQERIVGDDATKERLTALFRNNGRNGAALCFTATHGMGFGLGDPRQEEQQGALLCQDWPGVGHAPDRGHYFTGADVPDDADLKGRIFFHFACYGAGTPERDEFFRHEGEPPRIAERPFVARLPQTLLGHPNGGALAVIGHIERAWGCSIAHPDAGPQLLPFSNTSQAILDGQPVGHAVGDFNDKFASVSAELSQVLEDVRAGAKISDSRLAGWWLERNDARNYAVIGDPAVRLRV